MKLFNDTLRRAIYSKLTSPAITSGGSNVAVGESFDADSVYPRIVLGSIRTSPRSTKSGFINEARIDIDVVEGKESGGSGEVVDTIADTIAQRIDNRSDRLDLSPNFKLIAQELERVQGNDLQLQSSFVIFRRTMTFKFIIEEL